MTRPPAPGRVDLTLGEVLSGGVWGELQLPPEVMRVVLRRDPNPNHTPKTEAAAARMTPSFRSVCDSERAANNRVASIPPLIETAQKTEDRSVS